VDERTQALLESADPAERLQGLRLVALGEDQDAAPLVERLLARDEDAEVREHGVRALAVTRGAAAREALLAEARRDADPMVRRTALAVIGEIGERDLAHALAAMLDELDAHDQPTAIDALRASGARGVLRAIEGFAAAENAHVRALVLHAWAALAEDARASAAIMEVAREVAARGPLWALPAAALVSGEDAARALAAGLERAHRHERESAVYRALDHRAPVALACLGAIVAHAERHDEREVGLAAARELARRGDAAGARVLARVLYDPEARGRLGAAVSLAELGAPLGEALLRRTFESPTPAERGPVARALALLGREEGVRALGALLASDLPADRRFGALAFAELGRSEGAAELVRTLDYPLQSERREALEALRRLWPEGPAIDPLAAAAERASAVALWAAHFARS